MCSSRGAPPARVRMFPRCDYGLSVCTGLTTGFQGGCATCHRGAQLPSEIGMGQPIPISEKSEPRCLPLNAHHGQDHVGGMFRIVQDLLLRDLELRVGAEAMAGIEVPVPARKAAGGDLQPGLVARQEDVARCPQVNHVLVGPAGLDQRWRLALSKKAR